MSNVSPTYTAVAANIDTDRDKILTLWKRGLSHAGMPEEKFDWFYQKNPAGAPATFFLYCDDEVEPVGVAAVGIRKLRIGGQTITSGELVDFVALPEHRTLFPALFLQKEIRRLALEVNKSHALLYGLPNPKSLAVVKRVGYRLVGQMVRRARILRSAGYLSRYAPLWMCQLIGPVIDRMRIGLLVMRGMANRRLQLQWLDRPDCRFDDLWQRVVTHEGAGNILMGIRDAAFLTWRFVDCPLRTYRFFTLTSAANDRIVAYAACTTDGDALHVHDFLVDPTERFAGRGLWLTLSREAFRRGHSNISVEFLSAESSQSELQVAGMLKRQQRPLYAAAATNIENTLDSAKTHCQANLFTASNWYLTRADEDG
jgi:hypothetical protein